MSTSRVEPEDRYTLRKVPAVRGVQKLSQSSQLSRLTMRLLGFYTLIYRMGYREKFDVKVDAFIEQVCDLEAREDPQNSASTVAEIRAVAKRVTHM